MAIQYHLLNRSHNEIRLLKLLLQAHNKQHKLISVCHIFHVCLFKKSEYVALFYVWKASEDKCIILIEYLQICIRANLYNALIIFRLLHKYLIIWIDSPCIDQINDEEKSWQVELIKDIYQQAIQMYIWLESADNDSNYIINYLNTFDEKVEAYEIYNVKDHYLEI